MSGETNALGLLHTILHHVRSEDARHHSVPSRELDPMLARLREFQANRIARTYRDFAAQPEFAPALDFFLSDLYAPRDFAQRDHDAERLYRFLSRFVPAHMLQLAADAIELTRLTYTLDEQMVRQLSAQSSAREKLTPATYVRAFRQCDNYAERERQLDLTLSVLSQAADAAHLPLGGAALRLAHGPAHAAGWHEMFDFLQRGYRAFKRVHRPERFLDAVEARESKILQRIWAGDPNPF